MAPRDRTPRPTLAHGALKKLTRRRLSHPPFDLGYGDEGSGDDIPGGATLHFDIEVVHVSETPPLPNVFMQMDTDSSGSLTLEEVLWFAQGTGASQNQAAQTFRSQDIDGDGVISWHEFDGPKTGPMGVDVKSLKDEP